MIRLIVGMVLTASLAACVDPPDPEYTWPHLPVGFPLPAVPDDNPMTETKVELGRHLFYDVRLSGNQTFSCASCHAQNLAFTDGLGRSIGSTGEMHPRGAMSLANMGYNLSFNWADGNTLSLERQALVPLFGDNPVELGLGGLEDDLLERLRTDLNYPAWFATSFPGEPEAVTIENMVKALSAFQRTLISGNSPFDQATYQGQASALSDAARRGFDLFNSERLECFHCHGGFNFQDSVFHDGSVRTDPAFHNNALFNVDGDGAYPAGNRGLFEQTQRANDMGRFKAPTLRNIALTAPYMHDGSLPTLEAVIDEHYARGGRLTETGPNAGDGALSPLKSGFLVGFTLTDQERDDLIAFLESLTDETFTTEPDFSDPF